MTTTKERLEIKPYTTQELSVLYNMSSRTFRRNIAGIKEKLGKRIGHFYNVKQVEIIMEHMGRPYEVFS
jgi:hypothetical protein